MDIKAFIKEYKDGDVQITPDISYSVRTVIEENRRLYHSKFKQPKDSGGLEKIFYNIGYILFDTLFRNTDLDTKDINMRSLNGKAIPVVSILKMAVKSNLKRSYFGTFVNELRRVALRDGSTLVKKIPGGRAIVDNLNWIENPHQTDPQRGGGVEKILMTWDEVLAKKDQWADKWSEVLKIREKMKEKGISDFIVYEYWHEFEIKGKLRKGCEVYIDGSILDPEKGHSRDDWDPNIKLDEYSTPYKRRRKTAKERKELGEYEDIYPYKKLHSIPVDGRSIGFSPFELCKGLIAHYNELFNNKRKRDLLDLRGIITFHKGSQARSIPQQFLENLEIGDVVELEEDEKLQRLVMDRVTGDVLASADKLFEIARMVTGAMPQAVGEELPSGTPATIGVINQQNAKTTYDVIIEQMSLFLVEWFEDFEMPEIIDELDAEEVVAITGEPADLQELDRLLVDNAVYSQVQRIKEATGIFPEEEQIEAERERLMQQLSQQGDTRFAEIKKFLLKNVSYMLEFYVNNETFDKKIKLDAIQSSLADPNTTLSRSKLERTKFDLLDMAGKQFEKTEKEKAEEIQLMKEKIMLEQGQSMPNAVQELPANPVMTE